MYLALSTDQLKLLQMSRSLLFLVVFLYFLRAIQNHVCRLLDHVIKYVNVSKLFKLAYLSYILAVTGFEMISQMRERERERERDRERERERVKTVKQAGGFTLFIINMHKKTNFYIFKVFMGFIGRKYQRSA